MKVQDAKHDELEQMWVFAVTGNDEKSVGEVRIACK